MSENGLDRDRVTQPYHGGAGAAVCVHLADHYRYWNTRYGMSLKSGNVGENFTLEGTTEDQICVGDIVRVSTALLQVSGPRVPCANQARHIGRPDWVKLTIAANRTGFYTRVLEPGIVQAGEHWKLQERWNADGAITAINSCAYLSFEPEYALRLLEMSGLDDWWKKQILKKFKTHSKQPANTRNE